jgi:2-oxoglutarate ferredoxin oxidoreductase subunit gamma
LKPDGLLIVDSTFIEELPLRGAVAIPFTQIARQKLGREVAANIVALGALAALTKAVSLKSLEAAVLGRVPPHTRELNQKALQAGVDAARRVVRKQSKKTVSGE